MPWRAGPGERADPYHVWLSEIMLQQTTVATVGPYFRKFLSLFPTVAALAAAPEERVMAAWAGLGYYARARNLHRCAQAVTARGGFPDTEEELRTLPGIGSYTARAVAAIAFDRPGVPVDGNVERVCSRLFAIEAPLPASRPRLAEAAARLGEDPAARAHPSDFAQALFDLGATICTPRRPACALCPWRSPCRARAAGTAEELPRKLPRAARPDRHGTAFLLLDDENRLLLRRRPPRGLLGGMSELPGTPWREAPWTAEEAQAFAPAATAPWQEAGDVRHVFTHFALTLRIRAARLPGGLPSAAGGAFLCPLDALENEALPTLMRRAVATGLAALGDA
ncbi:A/G-specific adenine glycosylase [Acetobacteraceae bacterium KSS12]|uniref:Adenine DNA glycosylase n=2 Tax=Rhizosaccharibacter radicis TaxID=2782605 RepID=A0ABT1VXB5_9PROT|nr:A/G-specific adenine glycosylase [Acetobacteraceae bacterium KSS12]